VDAAACVVTASSEIEDNGTQPATCTIQVLNTDGNPMVGLAAANIVLAVSGTGNTVTQPTGVTNANGVISGSFVSTVAATKTVSFTVLSTAVTDTASVVVGEAEVFAPNLPSGEGLSLQFDTVFDATAAENEYNSEGFAYSWDGDYISGVSGAPYATTAFETTYAAGSLGGGTGGAKIYTPETSVWRKIYFSLSMWVPSNYSIHSNTEKFWYPLIATNGSISGNTPINWRATEGSPGDATFGFAYIAAPGNVLETQSGTARITKGQWTKIECFMQMNTPDTSNGVLKIWVDGAVAEDRSNMRYINGATQSVWNGMRFDGTRGGGDSTVAVPAGGQVRRYNRLAFYASDT
jgi:hypothetical protein